MHNYTLALKSQRRLFHTLIWLGCILAGLALATPVIVMRPFNGTSPRDFVVHENGFYYQVAGFHHGQERKLQISARQYQRAREIGEISAAGAAIGAGLVAAGLVLLFIRSARHRRHLRQARRRERDSERP